MNTIFKIMASYFTTSKGNVCHITGANGTGKSLLIKDFLKYFLPEKTIRIFYLDTESKFSKKNYSTLNIHDQQKIFVKNIPSPRKLTFALRQFQQNRNLMKKGDILIIDSISEFLKQKFVETGNYYEWKKEIQTIIEIILPLIQFLIINREIHVIFVHHVSYSPTYEQNLPFYHELFDFLPGLWYTLKKNVRGVMNETFAYDLILSIYYAKQIESHNQIFQKNFEYTLENGFFKQGCMKSIGGVSNHK